MKNWINSIISIVAIVLSIFAIAKVAPTQIVNFDYLGAIIGVLSFLVTLLIGYQIYTVINVKEELKEVRQARKEIDDKLQQKGEELSKEYKEELRQAAPIIMAIASQQRDVIESAAFQAYKNSKPNQLAREIASMTIFTIIDELTRNKDGDDRTQLIEELSRNITYDEAVEFYTDFAKMEDKKGMDGIEPFMLELIGILSEKKKDEDKE